MVCDGVLDLGVLAEIRCDLREDTRRIFLLGLLGIDALSIPCAARPGIAGQGLLHTEAVVCPLCQLTLSVAGLQDKLCCGNGCQDTGIAVICLTEFSDLGNRLFLGHALKDGCLSAGCSLGLLLRNSSRQLVLHCFTEGVHGVSHAQLTPEMFRVTVVGCNPPRMAFLVADDNSISQRIETILLAEHSKQFHRRLISSLGYRPRSRKVRAFEGCTASIGDAGWLTHLHADVGVVCGAIDGRTAMPPSVVPRQGLIHRTVIAVNETVDTGTVK